MNTFLIALIAVLITAVVVWLIARAVIKNRLEAGSQPTSSEQQGSAELRLAFDEHLQKSLRQSQELMISKIENITNKILEDKTKNFEETSSQSINQLLEPVETQMKGFRERMEKIHHENTEKQTELRTVIDSLEKQNSRLSEDAENLTKALKGKPNTQGQWGEMLLERALQTSGLQLGREYKLQPTYKGKDGNNLKPDAVVLLPNSKTLVIDSKVSLVAYTRFVSAEGESERDQALEDHAKAMQNHVAELAKKDYEEIPNLGSPEAVFMFTPIESALPAALTGNPNFMTEAQQKRIYVVTPSTIIPVLTIVAQLWQLADQEKNTEEIITNATGLYDKAVSFVESLQKVGKHLDEANKSYGKAINQLSEGRGNLIKRADDLKKLGISSKKVFPEDISRKAELEIEPPPRQLEGPKQKSLEEADDANAEGP